MLKFEDVINFVEGNTALLLKEFNLLDEEVQAVALARMEICKACPHLTTGKKPRCSECGCRFPGLTYAPKKKCPLNKW